MEDWRNCVYGTRTIPRISNFVQLNLTQRHIVKSFREREQKRKLFRDITFRSGLDSFCFHLTNNHLLRADQYSMTSFCLQE
uniref:Uncharacterized protein n=1 Tax=Anguilla anguilla TaxID=7936 RepID=A0A0E9X185_ANGAN